MNRPLLLAFVFAMFAPVATARLSRDYRPRPRSAEQLRQIQAIERARAHQRAELDRLEETAERLVEDAESHLERLHRRYNLGKPSEKTKERIRRHAEGVQKNLKSRIERRRNEIDRADRKPAR